MPMAATARSTSRKKTVNRSVATVPPRTVAGPFQNQRCNDHAAAPITPARLRNTAGSWSSVGSKASRSMSTMAVPTRISSGATGPKDSGG